MGIPQFYAKDQFSVLTEVLSDQGIDVEGVKDTLKAQEIEPVPHVVDQRPIK